MQQLPDTPVINRQTDNNLVASSSKQPPKPTDGTGGELTYKQRLKQDAMLWAEYLYSEYKREQASLEEALDNEQLKPTYHDDKIT